MKTASAPFGPGIIFGFGVCVLSAALVVSIMTMLVGRVL